MISYLIDQIPWWVYVTAALLGGGALFYFFSPILLPLWAALPKPVKIALGAAAAVFVAYVAGRNKGNRDAKDLQHEREAEAIQTRLRVDQEINNLDRPTVDKRLDRWMRD